MHVRGLGWLGTRAERFEQTVAFAEGVLGLGKPERSPGIAVFTLPDGTAFEIFAPGHPGGGHPSGVVAGFEVDDADAAREELLAAGCEVSELQRGETVCWAYFRAPDGGVYEVFGPCPP